MIILREKKHTFDMFQLHLHFKLSTERKKIKYLQMQDSLKL